MCVGLAEALLGCRVAAVAVEKNAGSCVEPQGKYGSIEASEKSSEHGKC